MVGDGGVDGEVMMGVDGMPSPHLVAAMSHGCCTVMPLHVGGGMEGAGGCNSWL